MQVSQVIHDYLCTLLTAPYCMQMAIPGTASPGPRSWQPLTSHVTAYITHAYNSAGCTPIVSALLNHQAQWHFTAWCHRLTTVPTGASAGQQFATTYHHYGPVTAVFAAAPWPRLSIQLASVEMPGQARACWHAHATPGTASRPQPAATHADAHCASSNTNADCNGTSSVHLQIEMQACIVAWSV